MSKINRNDPCPCRSGKKYKNCCMNKVQAPRRQRVILAGQIADQDNKADVAEAMAAYEEKFKEVEKLTKNLDDHQLEFQRLMNKPQKLADSTRELFAAEQFKPYRYSTADVQRACAAAAYPQPPAKGSTEYGQFLILTTGYLADKKRRLEIACDLLDMAPTYVEEERFIDAWLLQLSALQMVETPTEANLFLTEMLNYGLGEREEETETEAVVEAKSEPVAESES